MGISSFHFPKIKFSKIKVETPGIPHKTETTTEKKLIGILTPENELAKFTANSAKKPCNKLKITCLIGLNVFKMKCSKINTRKIQVITKTNGYFFIKSNIIHSTLFLLKFILNIKKEKTIIVPLLLFL